MTYYYVYLSSYLLAYIFCALDNNYLVEIMINTQSILYILYVGIKIESLHYLT